MEIWRKISGSALRGIVERLFFCALFALPWINKFRVSTFLFLIIGAGLIFTGNIFINFSWYKKQFLFWVFFSYYLIQVLALFIYPHDSYVHADIERKVSLIVIPFLLNVLIAKYTNIWRIGIIGFIYGNTFAALCCLINAIINFFVSGNHAVFFYHQYASMTGLNAIYFSLYLLTALGYIVLNSGSFQGQTFIKLIIFFLYFNILLLSSKIMIIAGTLLLIASVLRSIRKALQKVAILSVLLCMCLMLASTGNPIRKRYTDINTYSYSSVLSINNFTNYSFDGLSIRLLLWRLGNNLVNEKKMQLFGAGGERYHQSLNIKLKEYHVYSGKANSTDVGYQNYNMHDQYMESYLQFGLTGVTLIVAMLLSLIYYSIRIESPVLLYIAILFSTAFVTESVLETQSGILLFTIITSGEWIQSQRKQAGIQSSK
jgi:O-antigen ligase